MWVAPFVMANINTRNVHRSNFLLGFPYGKDFIYDEMVVAGPRETGRGDRKAIIAANNKLGAQGGPKPGEGPSKEERESGHYDLLFVGIASDGRQVARRRDRRPRSRLWIDLEDDRRMCDLPAARYAGRCGRLLDAGRCDGGRD